MEVAPAMARGRGRACAEHSRGGCDHDTAAPRSLARERFDERVLGRAGLRPRRSDRPAAASGGFGGEQRGPPVLDPAAGGPRATAQRPGDHGRPPAPGRDRFAGRVQHIHARIDPRSPPGMSSSSPTTTRHPTVPGPPTTGPGWPPSSRSPSAHLGYSAAQRRRRLAHRRRGAGPARRAGVRERWPARSSAQRRAQPRGSRHVRASDHVRNQLGQRERRSGPRERAAPDRRVGGRPRSTGCCRTTPTSPPSARPASPD